MPQWSEVTSLSKPKGIMRSVPARRVQSVDIVDPDSDGELERFVQLEHTIFDGHPLFVSEPDLVVKARLTRASAFFERTRLALFVASESGRGDVARCAAIINRRWQDSKRDPNVALHASEVGFIGYFAAAPGAPTAVEKMLRHAEKWLYDRGMRRVIAPCNGNALVGMGVLTDAFAESPMFPMPWSPDYYAVYLERADYAPAYPIWAYEIDFSSDAYQRFKQAALPLETCTVHEIDRGDWDDEINRLRKLFNRGFRGEWELQRFTRREFREFYGDEMSQVLPPQFILFARVPRVKEPVGFCVGFPDWTPLYRPLRGQRAPTEAEFKSFKPERAGVIGGALKSKYRDKHLAPKVAAEFFKRMEEDLELPGALYYFINHINAPSRRLGESAGGRGRILYHCYERILARRPKPAS